MPEKSQQNTFHKIMEERNSVLEVGIFEGILRLRLTVTESVGLTHVYIGEIRDICDHEKLNEYFDTLPEALQFFKDSKNVKLNLEEKSVALVIQAGKKSSELIKIMLNQLKEEETIQLVSLDDVIDRCNQKEDLSNHEIKDNFEILAKEILQLKQMNKKEIMQNIKEEMLVALNVQSEKSNQKVLNLERTYLVQIKEIRKQIEAFGTKYETEFGSLQKYLQNTYLTQINENRKQTSAIDTKYETKFGQLKKQIETKEGSNSKDNSQLKKMMTENFQRTQKTFTKKIQKLHQQNSQILSSNSQKTKNLQQQITSLNIFIQKQKLYQQFENKKQFNFNGKIIDKINDGFKYFVIFEEVPFFKQFRFMIKIVQSKKRWIKIGICDYQQIKQNNLINNNSIGYDTSNGKICPNGIKEGDGVEVGETVEVVVNRNSRTIKWIVNGVLRASATKDMFGDKGRKLFPYVDMYDKQDTIEFLMK